jgi:hypothetical protein
MSGKDTDDKTKKVKEYLKSKKITKVAPQGMHQQLLDR